MYIKSRLLLLLLLVAMTDQSIQNLVHPFTPDNLETLLNIIDDKIINTNCTLSEMKLIRFATHDCFGGCDGSLNFSNPSNFGLTKELFLFYEGNTKEAGIVRSFLSRADFSALVGMRALGQAILNDGKFAPYTSTLPMFKYGRVDHPKGFQQENFQATFPQGRQNWEKILSVMSKSFNGMSERDLVILMGTHGGGANSPQNSGFSGPWLKREHRETVSNEFYRAMLGLDNFKKGATFKLVNSTGGKLQWEGTRGATARTYLTGDLHMYLNLTVDENGFTQQRYYPQAVGGLKDKSKENPFFPALSRNAELVYSFALDNEFYITELLAAFGNMLQTPSQWSYHGLSSVGMQIVCVDGCIRCIGDIFFTNCGLKSKNIPCN